MHPDWVFQILSRIRNMPSKQQLQKPQQNKSDSFSRRPSWKGKAITRRISGSSQAGRHKQQLTIMGSPPHYSDLESELCSHSLEWASRKKFAVTSKYFWRALHKKIHICPIIWRSQQNGAIPQARQGLFLKMIYVKHYRSSTVGSNCYSILFRQTSMEMPNFFRKALFARRLEFRANETLHRLPPFEV
ncbi:hypothetical protein GO496_02225 [Acidovorax citrulli]|nr:hypothetical protein [Paracidovorax citrulli]